MVSDRLVQLVLQVVVCLSLIALAAYYVTQGQTPPEWLVAAILAVLGVLFGFSAANGYVNSRKKKG